MTLQVGFQHGQVALVGHLHVLFFAHDDADGDVWAVAEDDAAVVGSLEVGVLQTDVVGGANDLKVKSLLNFYSCTLSSIWRISKNKNTKLTLHSYYIMSVFSS